MPKHTRGVSDHEDLDHIQISLFELKNMRAAEHQQVDPEVDTFWGLDEEAERCSRECKNKLAEDASSEAWEAYMRQRSLIAQWDEEDVQTKYNEAYGQALVENRARQAYIKELHGVGITKEIMYYQWPTRSYVLPAPEPKRAGKRGGKGGASAGEQAMSQWDVSMENGDMGASSMYQQPTYDESMDAMLFGIMQIDNQQSSVIHGEALQKTRSIEAQFEEGADLAASVLKGKNVGTNIAERAMFPRAQPRDPSHGGGLEQSLGMRMTKPNKGKFKGLLGGTAPENEMSGTSLNDGGHPNSLAMVGQTLPHVDELDGHPVYKWDQEMILRASFDLLVNNSDNDGEGGRLSLAYFILNMNQDEVRDLLKFTVFGAWIKLRQWHMFETIFGGAEMEQDDDIYREEVSVGQMTLNMEGWLQAARAAASEEGVLPQHIRTQDEHKNIVKSSGPWLKILGVGNKAWFADMARDSIYRTSREAYLARRLNRGDFVWGLYGASCCWLPATVTRANDDGTFDLAYPLSSRGLQDARVAASSKELLQLPSMERTREHNPRPESDERTAVAFAFDLVDEERAGAVEPQQLLSALKSPRFEKIVKSSAALYLVFGALAGAESLEKNLVDTCSGLHAGGLIEKDAFVEYCMVATDLSTFNAQLSLIE
jgi:hypothetical protein